jgi:hypothetical protein
MPMIAAAVAAAALAGSLLGAGSAWAATSTVVASGLDNPRDLAFTPSGKLYVAQAGHGGSECLPGGPGGGATCVGFTSSIARIMPGGEVVPVVTGLVSAAGEDGTFATGIDGISTVGDTIFGVITESSDLVPPGPNPFLSPETVDKARAELGRLIEGHPNGTWSVAADVGHADFEWTAEHQSLVPDQFPDANPYGVFATRGIKWVVDAAANTLDEVFPNGVVRVVAFFPNPPVSDAVPTCIDRGPDGAFYVGELTGGGNAPGASVVWRVEVGHAPTVWASGLTAVTGCGFGANGQFYAVEFSTLDNAAPGTGALVRVPAHSTAPVVVVDELNFPGGFAAAKDGSIYLSNWSVMPAENHGGPTGQVLRIQP